MSMFEMSDEAAAEFGQKLRDLVAPEVNGEEVVSAAAFRRGGATASMVASKAQLGGVVYAGIKMFNKKKAGGLPERVVLALTPDKLYAFNLGFKGRDYKLKGEAASWARGGLQGLIRGQVGNDRGDDRVAGRRARRRPWSGSASRTTRSAWE